MSISNPTTLEPELDDMLTDPIIQLMMKCDGVSKETLWPLLKQASEKLQQAEAA